MLPNYDLVVPALIFFIGFFLIYGRFLKAIFKDIFFVCLWFAVISRRQRPFSGRVAGKVQESRGKGDSIPLHLPGTHAGGDVSRT